ncbi:MAG: hypothetical protein ACRCV0_04890 [Brevinema sp.]
MSFSYSELSSLLSNKRLRLDKNISLSNLADNFQRASREFPSLARLSQYTLEDLILKGNAGSFDSKKEGISGKDIELKFLIDARKNSFKIDSYSREYQFTDEDKLAFSMDEREFFDLFDRQDRGLGQYLKEIFRETRSSYLPDKIGLNHKLNGSPTHRDLMDKIQRSWSKKVVSLGEVSEKILKEMGQSSPSSSQIFDLAKKIADENRLNGDPAKAYIFRDQIEKLSTKVIGDSYVKMPLTSEENRDRMNGVFRITKIDEKMGLKKVLEKLNTSSKLYLNGKEIKGNETIKEGDCIVEIKNVKGEVYQFQTDISWTGVDTSFKEKVMNAMIELYCDYKKKGKTWRILEISSAYRTEEQQANAMVDYILVKGRDELVKIYDNSIRRDSLNLISSLYYDGNHLICRDMGIDEFIKPCKYGSANTCKEQYQYNLLNKLSPKEKEVFTIYTKQIYPNGNINLKSNTPQIKTITAAWLKASGMKSKHQLGIALDFSSKTPIDQRGDFINILKTDTYKIKSSVYSSGNFHIN